MCTTPNLNISSLDVVKNFILSHGSQFTSNILTSKFSLPVLANKSLEKSDFSADYLTGLAQKPSLCTSGLELQALLRTVKWVTEQGHSSSFYSPLL